MKFSLVSALLVATNALLVSSQVTFKVIAIDGTPSVVIGSKKYKMNLEQYPVYSVTVDSVNAPVKYHYVLGKEEEKFTRTADSDTTLNEFFNRAITIKKHPLLPKAYESFPTIKKSKLFDDTHVDTIVIEGKKSDIDYLNANPNKDKKIPVKITYVTPYAIKVFQDGGIKVSGQSTKYNKKLSYKISGLKLNEDKELYGRTALKLRAEYGDPSFMREKTFFDMLNAIGVPSSQSKFARVFMNKTSAGLYLITDDFSNKSFLKHTFHNGKKFDIDNAVFKVNSNGDLSYKTASSKGYEPYSYKGDIKDADNKKMIQEILVPFMKEVDNYPKTQKIGLDVEAFLRNMAMEYLGYGTDNYWLVQGNYFLFKNMASGQWHMIDSDFDMTFGHGSPGKCLKLSLDDYVTVKNKGNSRPLIDNIRKVSKNDKYLKDAVKRMVQSTFNINAVGPRLDSFYELLRDDAYWDFTLPGLNTYSGDHEVKVKKHYPEDFDRELQSTTSTSYPYPIKKWIIERSKSVASIYKFSVPSSPDTSLGYYEPKYETKDDEGNTNPNPPVSTTTTTTTTTTDSSKPTSTNCWSLILGYPCCQTSTTKVYTTDSYGSWGIENNQWCGIPTN